MRNVYNFKKPRRKSYLRRQHGLLRVFPIKNIVSVAIIALVLFCIQSYHRNSGTDLFIASSNAAQPYKENNAKNNTSLISCNSPYIIDGDTFDCNGTRIRLTSIDAPEMPDHCKAGRHCTAGDPFASKNYLQSLAAGAVTCQAIEKDHYGRTVAKCAASGKDLSCAMVKAGHAVERYGTLSCDA